MCWYTWCGRSSSGLPKAPDDGVPAVSDRDERQDEDGQHGREQASAHQSDDHDLFAVAQRRRAELETGVEVLAGGSVKSGWFRGVERHVALGLDIADALGGSACGYGA